MNDAGPRCRLRNLAAVGAILWLGWGAGTPARAQERIAVDRWLVSSPFPAAEATDPLKPDYLAGAGEASVLPDRGRTVDGADWTLVREDSAWAFPLPTRIDVEADSVRGETASRVVAYAHAYIRSPSDRTVRLMWGGVECTTVSAWLNGRRVDALGVPAGDSALVPGVRDARTAVVRIGYGYNTLLLKAAQGDCAFGIGAGIAAVSADSLAGVQVRASRPYGDTRTGPEQWIVAGAQAGPEAILGWKGQELFGAAAVRLAAFSVTAIGNARLDARVDGKRVRRTVEWLEPASPRAVLMPFEFGNLQRASLRGKGLELELKWGDSEWKGVLELRPEPLLRAFGSPIRLLGWAGPRAAVTTGIQAGEGDVDDPHPLANLIPLPEEGETLVGEWKVPGWLSGFTLRLDTEGAPGTYRLASIPVESDGVVLCSTCRKGETIQLVVETTGDWSGFPGVVIMDPAAGAEAFGSPDAAAEWLGWIDEKGSRRYRERAAEAARAND